MSRQRLHVLSALVLGAALLTVPRAACAYRPFDGTDAEVAEFGELELEIGSAYTFARSAPVILQVPALVVNVGIWPRLELVLETTNNLGKIANGPPSDQISDTHFFLKSVLRQGFAQDKTGPSIALEAGPWLPNPNGAIGLGASANLITSFEAGPMVFDVNLQGAYDLDHHVELFASVILEGQRSRPVRPVTEVFAQHAFGGSTIYSALVGAIWKARKAADIDIAAGAFSTDGVPAARVRLGFTWRAPLWHGQGKD